MYRLHKYIIAVLLFFHSTADSYSENSNIKADMEVKVKGLVCPSCAIGLKNIFKKHINVNGLFVDIHKELLLLDFRETRDGVIYYIRNDDIIKMVKKSGYEVHSIKRTRNSKPNRYNKP